MALLVSIEGLADESKLDEKREGNALKRLIRHKVILPAFVDRGESVWVCNMIGCDVSALVVNVFTNIRTAVTVTYATIAFGQGFCNSGRHCRYRLQEKRDQAKKAMLHD